MSNEIVRVDEINVEGLERIGKILSDSGYFNSDNARASAAQLMVKVLAGRELGYGPWASAAGIHIIKGRMTVSANLMADAVKRSGRYDYRIREMSDKRVAIEFFALVSGKQPESLGTSEFTIEDGKRAGTQNLDKFARNMLFARAMSNGVKWFAPDVFSGNAVYVAEEMGASVDGDGNVIDAPRTVNQTTGEVTYEATTQAEPELDLDRERKRLHAIGGKNFGKQWNAARPWLVKRYTAKFTPDNVRESGALLTAAEMSAIADTIDHFNGNLVRQFEEWQAAQVKPEAVKVPDDVTMEPAF